MKENYYSSDSDIENEFQKVELNYQNGVLRENKGFRKKKQIPSMKKNTILLKANGGSSDPSISEKDKTIRELLDRIEKLERERGIEKRILEEKEEGFNLQSKKAELQIRYYEDLLKEKDTEIRVQNVEFTKTIKKCQEDLADTRETLTKVTSAYEDMSDKYDILLKETKKDPSQLEQRKMLDDYIQIQMENERLKDTVQYNKERFKEYKEKMDQGNKMLNYAYKVNKEQKKTIESLQVSNRNFRISNSRLIAAEKLARDDYADLLNTYYGKGEIKKQDVDEFMQRYYHQRLKLAEDLKQAEMVLDEYKKRIDDMKEKIRELKKRKDKGPDDIDEYSAQFYQKQFEMKSEVVEQQKKEIDLLQNKLKVVENMLEESNKSFDKLYFKQSVQGANIRQDLSEIIKTKNTLIKQLQTKVAELSKSYNDLVNQYRSNVKELEFYKDVEDKLLVKLDQCQNDLKIANKLGLEQGQEIQELKQEIERLKS